MQLFCPISAGQPAGRGRRATPSEVAEELARAPRPTLITARMAKRLRPGKVFIDWSQNAAAKTTVSPYSLRAAPIPTVSTPLTWEEVEAGAAVSRVWSARSPREVLDRVARHARPVRRRSEPGPEVLIS